MQSQRDVESHESRNVNNQQQDPAPTDTLHSEELPVVTDHQQSRCFTEDPTSIACDQGRTPLNIPNANEPLEKGGC